MAWMSVRFRVLQSVELSHSVVLGSFFFGQVSYHNSKMVRKVRVEKDNSIVNRVSKTRREVEQPPLQV